MTPENYVDSTLARLTARNKGQSEYLQAVHEVTEDVREAFDVFPRYCDENILERLAEPDRIISFRVCWEDDKGVPQVNRGWRVQHSSLIGPYKGGLRFHPTVNESILKFLAFEQMFKNALTGLQLGAGKGGSDFDPRGRSDREIMRFCNSFMDELFRHIGDKIDIPAGDINVGAREIGYLFGHYRRLANNFSGVITGKDIEFGGSHVRLEATGFGLIYFVEEMLSRIDDKLEGKRVTISGSGNVALHAALKATEKGARVISLSSSKGTLCISDGLNESQIRRLLSIEGDSTKKLQSLEVGEWLPGEKPWSIECDIALPCATQNEIGETEARALVNGQCRMIAEGANMPCNEAAVSLFEQHRLPHAPGKASNAGGVALSALEMGQNAGFSQRAFADLDRELCQIMHRIHDQCVEHAGEEEDGFINYRRGANIAAFRRVASSMIRQGFG